MSDDSLLEDLERYRRNNFELAVALNEMKSELNTVQVQLLDKNRELQDVHSENATLKQSLAQKDSQINTWRACIIDLVTTNTRKYTELMQNVGLVPSPNGTTKPNESSIVRKTESTTVQPVSQMDVISKVQRRQRPNEFEDEVRLANLTEESISAQLNDSLTMSPATNINHVTSRRRTSAALTVPGLTTPSSPLRVIQPERLVANGETKRKKSSAKTPKLDKIVDENTQANGTIGRPSRKTAPKNLSEPKLGTKLRRN